MCTFTMFLSDQETIESFSKKTVARYSQRSKRSVNVKPNSPYLFIDSDRYPPQGFVFNEKMQSAGDLREFVGHRARKLSLYFLTWSRKKNRLVTFLMFSILKYLL